MANQQKVAEIYAELQLKTAQFKAALGEATGAMRAWAAETRRETMEAKASMALLGEEIGIRLPRHLRSFLAELPGVSKALSAAFNSVAIIALASIVIETGKKVYEFVQKTSEAAHKNAEANEKFASSLVLTNAQLDVANDKLEATLAKLKQKPENHFKEALDEAKLSAIDLSAKLEEAIGKQRELLESSSANWVQRFRGDASNEPLVKGLDRYQDQQRSEEKRYANDLDPRSLTVDDIMRGRKRTPQEAQLEHDNRRAQITGDYWNKLNTELSERQQLAALQGAGGGMTDERFALEQKYGYKSQDELIPALQNLMGNIGTIGWSQRKQADHDSLNFQVKGQQDTNDGIAKALQKLEQTVALDKFAGRWSPSGEAMFWRSHLNDFPKGKGAPGDADYAAPSPQYMAVVQKVMESNAAMLANMFGSGKLAALRAQEKADLHDAPKEMGGGRGGDALDIVTLRSAEAQAKLNEQFTQAHDKLLLLTGALTPHEAALRAAATHTATYQTSLAALKKELDNLKQEDTLSQSLGFTDDQNHAKQLAITTEMNALDARHQMQQLEDAQAAIGTTWRGMVDGVWDELIARAEQTQGELRQIATQFIDGINTELAHAITNQHLDFAGVFRSASQGIAKAGLERVEGSLVKSLGLGKRDGNSEGGALFVQNVGSGISGDLASVFRSKAPNVVGPNGERTGSMSSAASGLGTRALMGWLNDSNWASSLMGGRLFGSGSVFGHFASGGDVPGGVAIDVGELGPERFVTPGPGRIVPNSQAHRGGVTIGHIDARGTDPAVTQLAIQRAMQATHAQAVRDASRASADRQRRTAH